VKQLLNANNKSDCRYFLHLYLHSLFEVNPHAGKDFHDMQVGFVSLICKHPLFWYILWNLYNIFIRNG
jgi:hypothetical protein